METSELKKKGHCVELIKGEKIKRKSGQKIGWEKIECLWI